MQQICHEMGFSVTPHQRKRQARRKGNRARERQEWYEQGWTWAVMQTGVSHTARMLFRCSKREGELAAPTQENCDAALCLDQFMKGRLVKRNI